MTPRNANGSTARAQDPAGEAAPAPAADRAAELRRDLPGLFSPANAAKLPPAELEALVAENLLAQAPAHDIGGEPDWRPLLPTIRVPMLCVGGRHSLARPGGASHWWDCPLDGLYRIFVLDKVTPLLVEVARARK